MTVGKAIFDLLLGDADLRAIVNNRIFPEVAQQDAVLPYVVYNISSNEPSDTKREPSKLDTAQVEVNLYSTSYSDCIDMATHVRAALDRVTGTYSGVNVQSIQYLGEVIDFDEAQRAYNITSDYDVRISRSDFEIAQGSPITGVTLGELSDVDTTGVTHGQVIAYDAAAQEWQPADDAGGVTQLGQLTDVILGNVEAGELLKYDGGEWVNDTINKGDVNLSNVDNTSDANKPVSSATQTALNAKANSADFSNVDNTSDADKPVSTATQTALDAKANTSAVPTDLNDLSDVTIVGTPAANQALIYDTTASAFKSQVSYTNRFEDEVETGKQGITGTERAYSVKGEGDGVFTDAESDTPAAGKVIVRKIYHKTGFISDSDVIGDYTLIHTFADDTSYANTVATFDGFEDGATYGRPPFTLLQTWEEVTAAPAFTGLLNETYGSGPEAAYSTRRLNGNYTGAAIEVERSSDNTTQDIGFDANGDLDESALTTFCTGTTGKVRTWYDQSETGGTGSGNDAVQTTHGNQPTIYTGGAIVKENGRVALDYQGSQSLYSSSVSVAASMDVYHTTKKHTTTRQAWFAFDASSNTNYMRQESASSNIFFSFSEGLNFSVVGSSPETNRLTHNLYNAHATSGAQEVRLNGVSLFTDTDTYSSTGISGLYIGVQNNGANDFNGKYQEFILYDSVKSTADRTSIESNIGDYFTQNTPLLDTYTGAAAAYSLRKLRTAYTGDAVEVYNGSSYADIGFNVFGELDTVALATHCGSNDGFVSKWYDQSGNTNTAAQTVTGNMPKIYDGSTGVVTENGKPAVRAVGSSSVMGFNNIPISESDDYSTFVYKGTQSDWGSPLSSGFFIRSANQARFYSDSSQIATKNLSDLFNSYLLTTIKTGVNAELYRDSTSIWSLSGTVGSFGTTTLRQLFKGRFADANSQMDDGYIHEVIIYTSDQSANRTDIEDNINTFYSIY